MKGLRTNNQLPAGINSMASCLSRHSLKEIRSVPSDLHDGEPCVRIDTFSGCSQLGKKGLEHGYLYKAVTHSEGSR
jgi:hypothetical protein